MKKLITIMLALIMVMASLTGCSSKDKAIDTIALANEAISTPEFKDKLVEVDTDSILQNLYDINKDDLVSYKLYVSSTGATAEEIGVFEAKDNEAADRIITAVKERVEDLRFGFEGYVPEEINSIDNAVIKQCGKYVMIGIGSDYDTINSVFDKYIK